MPTPTRTVNGETREWNGSAWVPRPASADTAVPMHHPGLYESPANAFVSELERTGGEAAAGLARSPLDLVKNTLGMVAHPLDAVAGTAKALAHPVETIKALGNDPRAAGSLLGQTLLGEVAGPHLPAAVDAAPGVIGRGTAAVGRGMEAAGSSKLANLAEAGGLGDLAFRGDLKGGAIAAAPTALKYGGRGLQKLGSSIEGLQRAATDAPKPDSVLSGMTLSPDAVERNVAATNARDVDGFSHAQAGKLEGIPGAGQSKEIPYQAPASPGNTSLAGLKTSANGDLLSTYMDSLQGGVGSGQQSFEMDGKTFVPDGTGSHIAVPESWSNFVSDEPLSKADTMAPEDIDPHIGGSAPFSPDALPKVPASLDSLREAAFRQYANKPW